MIPVVGDFAAAQQPVIVVLNEGTSLTVQAVVSADRRFVRLTVVPFFSQIGDVQEFTFTGTTTTDSGTATQDPDEPGKTTANNRHQRTVPARRCSCRRSPSPRSTPPSACPTAAPSCSAASSGLSEGRNERGVPILSKLPYINRLFKNVGIGREAQSLMMMVTPRIIIQEEESKLLGNTNP